jgi:GDSL-like Lipase/Acylhydrolase family
VYGDHVAHPQLSKNLWSSVGISALALVAAVVVIMAMLQYRGPTTKATPVSGPTSASVPVRSTSTLLSTSATPTPAKVSTPTASPTGLALANSLLSAPSGASVLVIGDGTGDATDEWVAVWARDHLATNARVSYSAWDRVSSRYATAVRYGTTGQTINVWNASVRSPDMAREPARIAKAWQTSDLVLLSYGHRRAPATISAQMDAVLAAIRAKNATVPVVVMIQNPDRADTETIQRENTQKIQAWAGAHSFATVDIYSAFMADPTPRNTMVQSDGSPSPQGSRLWATTLAEALKTA